MDRGHRAKGLRAPRPDPTSIAGILVADRLPLGDQSPYRAKQARTMLEVAGRRTSLSAVPREES
jgi:hypothetical protein